MGGFSGNPTYGVLKGQVLGTRREDRRASPHYQILVQAGGRYYRVAVNVRASAAPADLLVYLDPDFRHPITRDLPDLWETFTTLSPGPGGLALDYIQGNLFNPDDMQPVPATRPGPHNDLEDGLDFYIQRAHEMPGAYLYAFGNRWGPEWNRRDPVFHFRPGNGVHNIHMNQGNAPDHADEDAPWQDGGLLLFLPDPGRWISIFLAFQSQIWRTDPETGHALTADLVI